MPFGLMPRGSETLTSTTKSVTPIAASTAPARNAETVRSRGLGRRIHGRRGNAHMPTSSTAAMPRRIDAPNCSNSVDT